MPHPIDNLTKQIPFPEEISQMIREVIIEKSYKRGDTITVDSDFPLHIYYISHGSARSYYMRGGRERTYSFAFEDEVVDTPLSLLNIPDTLIYIEFLEPTEVCIIPRLDVKEILERHKHDYALEIASYFIPILLDHTSRLEERILMFQLMNASERYNWFVTNHPTITERATLTQIASFLGIAKETIYRIRSGKYNV